jgi:hypothetical protein
MSSKWLESEGAQKRVTDLLYKAGVPLELEVEAICKQFAHVVNDNESINTTSEKVVYSTADEPETYRELDQLVTLYSEFELGVTGIQMIGNIPIECKSRSDIEYFAFPIEQNTAHFGFPYWNELGWSQCTDRLRSTYDSLSDLRTASISMLHIKKGEQPQSFSTEQLHYNGAGALYDFVLFNGEDISPEILFAREDEWLSDTGIFTRLQQEVVTSSSPLRALKTFIREVSMEQCHSFNEYAYQDGSLFHINMFQMPILCVNGPIYLVEWERSSGIAGYAPTKACILQIRKQGWPGSLRYCLLNQVVEVPVVLTNIEGLPECLNIALSWYQLIIQTLLETPRDLVERLPLEAALYTKGIECFEYRLNEKRKSYRSDLDRW